MYIATDKCNDSFCIASSQSLEILGRMVFISGYLPDEVNVYCIGYNDEKIKVDNDFTMTEISPFYDGAEYEKLIHRTFSLIKETALHFNYLVKVENMKL